MLEVTQIHTEDVSSGVRLSARLACPGTPLDGHDLWFSYPETCRGRLTLSGDPWLAAMLWPAMRLGHDLRIEAPVSPRLLEATDTFMDIMQRWDRESKRIAIVADTASPDVEGGPAVASFFSGGVDSFHTLLKHTTASTPAERRISHLIFAWGFDIDLDNRALHEQVVGHIRESVSALGGSLVACSTNVRKVVPEELAGWQLYHGGVMAALALGGQGVWNRVFIPASETYDCLVPLGTHPLVDPLWSTEAVSIIHDGAEATRIDKVRDWIAKSDVALQHLRVCWENRDGAYNCGACEKCIRTMLNLELAGVLDRCPSFAKPLSYDDVANLRLTHEVQHTLMAQNYETALAVDADPRLIEALRRCLYPSLFSEVRRRFSRKMRRLSERAGSRKGAHGST